MRIEPPPPQVSTTRLADPGHGPAMVAMLAGAFLAAAAASSLLTGVSAGPPRSDGSAVGAGGAASGAAGGASRVAAGAPGPAGASGPAGALPSPTEEPTLRPGEIACEPAGWRLAYIGSLGSWRVQTSLVVEPVAASDPLDARIPVAELGHDVVSGLGACAPPAGTVLRGRPAAVERAWRLRQVGGSDVATPIELVALGDASAGPGLRTDALELVRPTGTAAAWPPGAYVLELVPPSAPGEGSAAGQPAWLRLQLESPSP